jgi:ATP-dependent 26S proteasome regulatory subunit
MFLGWFKRLPKKIRRTTWFVVGLVALVLIAYLAWSYFGPYVPGDFTEARISASANAKTIVDTLKDSPQNLQKIQQLQEEWKDDQALMLLVTEFQKNQAARDASVQLSGELEKMAQSIPDIRPKKSAESALVAVTAETQLIYKLISFNDSMGQLIKLMQDKITNKIYGVDKVNQVVDTINSEVDSINQLNNQFENYLKTFDGSFN